MSSTETRVVTCEPCPKCEGGYLTMVTNRTADFFGVPLPQSDIKQCETCKFEEVAFW